MAKTYTSFFTAMVASCALLAASMPASAAIEIDEEDFGPSYNSMVVDTVAGKPVQLAAAVLGTATYVVSYPFSYFGGNKEQAKQKLVDEPWQAMDRCLGCSVAADTYYKSSAYPKTAHRVVVDQPSEVVIYSEAPVDVSKP